MSFIKPVTQPVSFVATPAAVPFAPPEPTAVAAKPDSFVRSGVSPSKALGLQAKTNAHVQALTTASGVSAGLHRVSMSTLKNIGASACAA